MYTNLEECPVLLCLDSAYVLCVRRHGEEATRLLVVAASGPEHCKSSKTWNEGTGAERK